MGFVRAFFNRPKPSQSDVAKNIERLGLGDFQQVAASQIELGDQYYNRVLMQAKQSFWFALFTTIIGIIFFFVASGLILGRVENMSYISLISGVVVEVVSGIGFALYAHASRQLASFHSRLDRVMLFLFANTVCEHINGNNQERDNTRAELVRIMANYSAQERK